MAGTSYHTVVPFLGNFEPAWHEHWLHQDLFEENAVCNNVVTTPPQMNSKQPQKSIDARDNSLGNKRPSTKLQPLGEPQKRRKTIAADVSTQQHSTLTSILSSTTHRSLTESSTHNESGGSTATRDVCSTTPCMSHQEISESSAKCATDGRPESPAASRSPSRRCATIDLPSFIRPFSTRIGPVEVSYLSSKGALSLPPVKDLLVLLEAYAHFVHPFNPFLDIESLLGVCRNHANPSERVTQIRGCDRISLLSLNAALGAATSYVDMACIRRMEFASYNSARDTFYMRAKLLYDMDCESDPFSVQQALALMTYWVGIPSAQKDTWHWHGLSVNKLQLIILQEPNSPRATTLDQPRKLQRRLWWSCFIRDACLALGLKCAPRMKFDESTTAMLTLDDFDEIPVGMRQSGSTSASRPRCYTPERTLAATFIQMAKLCLIINGIQDFLSRPRKTSFTDTSAAPCCGVDYATKAPFVTNLFAQRLRSWLVDLPAECRYGQVRGDDQADHHFDGLEARVKVHVVLLNMFYCSGVCHLHFPQLIKETRNNIGQLYGETITPSVAVNMVRAAVHELTALAAMVIRNDLIDNLPASSSSALIPAIVVHLAVIHSKSLSQQPTALQDVGTCLRVLSGMVAKYESARLLMDRFRESLNEAGLRLDDLILTAQQQLQTTSSPTHLGSVPTCNGPASSTDINRHGAGSGAQSTGERRSTSGMTEHNSFALGQRNARDHHNESSTNSPSAPIPVPLSTLAEPADSYDFLAVQDDEIVPALGMSAIGMGDDTSDTVELLPSSYMLEALDRLPNFLDFSFEDF